MTEPDPSPASERPPSIGSAGTGAHPALETSQPQPPPQQQQLLPDLDEPPVSVPAPFQPIFSLVTDNTTRQIHHPRVHYIFADDDPEVLTDALAQYSQYQHQLQQYQLELQIYQKQLQQLEDQPDPPSSKDNTRESTRASGSGSGSSSSWRPPPPPPQPPQPPGPPPPRALVVDLVPKPAPSDPSSATTPGAAATATTTATGTASSPTSSYDVAWASSLSTDWAVVSAKIGPMSADAAAPSTQTSESDDAAPAPPRLMLRVEGVGVEGSGGGSALPPPATARPRPISALVTQKRPSQESMSGSGSRSRSRGVGAAIGSHGQEYGPILDEFDRRMGMLRKVVGAGVERQAKLAAAETETGGGEIPAAVAVEPGVDDQAAVEEATAVSTEHAPGPEQEQEQEQGPEPDEARLEQQGTSQAGASGADV